MSLTHTCNASIEEVESGILKYQGQLGYKNEGNEEWDGKGDRSFYLVWGNFYFPIVNVAHFLCIWLICEYFLPFHRLSFWPVDYFIFSFIFSFVSFKILFIYSCMHGVGHTWRTEYSLCESVLPFSHMYPRKRTQVIKFGGKSLHPLSSLVSPIICFFCSVKVTWFVVILFVKFLCTAYVLRVYS